MVPPKPNIPPSWITENGERERGGKGATCKSHILRLRMPLRGPLNAALDRRPSVWKYLVSWHPLFFMLAARKTKRVWNMHRREETPNVKGKWKGKGKDIKMEYPAYAACCGMNICCHLRAQLEWPAVIPARPPTAHTTCYLSESAVMHKLNL